MVNKMNSDYAVEYSNRKTLAIFVERDKSIIIKAPIGTPKEKIDDYVSRKKYWIYTKLKHPQKYELEKAKEFVSGASIIYLGHFYKLELVDENTEGVHFDNNRFIISKEYQDRAPNLFKSWYVKKAKEVIIPKVNYYANNLGVEYNQIKITDMKYRWGSCTPKNNLNFNWRLIKAPISIIKYVIIHELAHFIEPNHNQKFWNVVETQTPKSIHAKEWLKENGELLYVDFLNRLEKVQHIR